MVRLRFGVVGAQGRSRLTPAAARFAAKAHIANGQMAARGMKQQARARLVHTPLRVSRFARVSRMVFIGRVLFGWFDQLDNIIIS
jgi:hypothetical protein